MAIDLVSWLSGSTISGADIIKPVDGRFTASGHENGGVYIFNNDTGRLLHSLPGKIFGGNF